jgi:hypothetical protein
MRPRPKLAVAVIDSGVDGARVAAPRVVPGINLSGDGAADDTLDRFGHGSQVALTIAAHAPMATILPVKLLGDRGCLRQHAQLEAAFEWILAQRVPRRIGVVCAAFADASCLQSDLDFRGTPMQVLIARLRDCGVPTVAPAGNGFRSGPDHGSPGMAWPAILREVVSVGALDRKPDRARVLTASTQRLRAQPGQACQTTVFSVAGPPYGASGAAAAVAGLLALLRHRHPRVSVERLVAQLVAQHGSDCISGAAPWPL